MARIAKILQNKRLNSKIGKNKKTIAEYRAAINDPELSFEEKIKIQKKWQKKKLFSSRMQRRCSITGRGRGVWRKLGMCRHFIRQFGMEECVVPGLVKSSW